MDISERFTTERNKKAPKKVEGTIHDYGSAPKGKCTAHYENIKPHNPSTEDWCIPADMEEGDYLIMENEIGTRGKNDGNEVVEEGSSPPPDLDSNEVIEADDETLPLRRRGLARPPTNEGPQEFGTRSSVYDTYSTE